MTPLFRDRDRHARVSLAASLNWSRLLLEDGFLSLGLVRFLFTPYINCNLCFCVYSISFRGMDFACFQPVPRNMLTTNNQNWPQPAEPAARTKNAKTKKSKSKRASSAWGLTSTLNVFRHLCGDTGEHLLLHSAFKLSF